MNKLFANTICKVSDDEDRIVEFVASKEVIDYDGDVVKVDGIDISAIKKNKSFLWSHRHTDLPVGKILSLKKDGKQLLGKAQMASEEEYPFGYTIYKLIKGGYINNVSISFLPDYSTMEYKEVKGKQVRVINNSTLLEISAVNIAANSSAVITTTKSLMDTYEKAWNDEVIDGEELNNLQEFTKNLMPEQTELVKKDIDIAVLQQKVHDLELQLLENNDNEDEYWAKILGEFEATSDNKSADGDHINDQDFGKYLDQLLGE